MSGTPSLILYISFIHVGAAYSPNKKPLLDKSVVEHFLKALLQNWRDIANDI